MATSDLPYDFNTGDRRYQLEEPLEHLQSMLNKKNVDIESLDIRGLSNDIQYNGIEPHELRLITGHVDADPEMKIRSSNVRNLNTRFDFDMTNDNPNYIFRDDVFTRNNVNTIRTGNASFAKARDLFVTPPPIDSSNKLFELVQAGKT